MCFCSRIDSCAEWIDKIETRADQCTVVITEQCQNKCFLRFDYFKSHKRNPSKTHVCDGYKNHPYTFITDNTKDQQSKCPNQQYNQTDQYRHTDFLTGNDLFLNTLLFSVFFHKNLPRFIYDIILISF